MRNVDQATADLRPRRDDGELTLAIKKATRSTAILSAIIGAVALVILVYAAMVQHAGIRVAPVSAMSIARTIVETVVLVAVSIFVARIALASRDHVVRRAEHAVAAAEQRITERVEAQHYQTRAGDYQLLVAFQQANARLGDQIVVLGTRIAMNHEELRQELKDQVAVALAQIHENHAQLAVLAESAPRLEQQLTTNQRALAQSISDGRTAGEEMRQQLRDEVDRMLRIEAAWFASTSPR